MLPHRREKGLLVRPLSDETLVYDLEIDRAHCLNPTAAAIWNHCDGRTSVPELAAMLRSERQITADEGVVWLALCKLQRARLLRERVQPPSTLPRLSRRELIRALGTAAAIPVVMTILAPTAMAQASDSCSGRTGDGTFCIQFLCPGLQSMCVSTEGMCFCN